MEKTAKVKEAKPTGRTWESKTGSLNHVHYVEFDNGDRGEYSSLSADQSKFIPGQEATYDMLPGRGTFPATIKPVQKGFSGGKKGYDREPFWERAIGFSASYTKDLVVAGKIDLKDMEVGTERMYGIMMKIYNANKSQQNGTV